MRTTILYILAILLALLATGCGDRRTADLLARADAVMESAPDSARTLIDSVDPSRLGGADLALYAVLDAQSRHKLGLDPPSDSLLTIAVDRCIAHGPDSLLMKALFYRAVGYQQTTLINDASTDAINSWEMAKFLRNPYWQAKTAELVADLAGSIQNYQDELVWRLRAADGYKSAGRQDNYLFTMCDVVAAHLNLHDSISTLHLTDSIRRLIPSYEEDPALYTYCLYNSVFVHNAFGKVAQTDSLYNLLASVYRECTEDVSLNIVKANILRAKGEWDSSKAVLDEIERSEHYDQASPMLYYAYFALWRDKKDATMTAKYAEAMMKTQSTMISRALTQPVTASHRDYLQSVAEQQAASRRRAYRMVVLVVCLSLLGSVAFLIIYRNLKKRKERLLNEKIARILAVGEELEASNLRNERNLAEIEMLRLENQKIREEIAAVDQKRNDVDIALVAKKEELRRNERDFKKLAKELHREKGNVAKIYVEQWKTLNMLCKEFLGANGTPAEILAANISKELDKLKSPRFLRKIEEELDRYADEIVGRLRKQCPSIDERDMAICILSFAGFSSQAVALSMGLPMTTLYSRQREIRNKIHKTAPPDSKQFLDCLKNGVR